MRPVPLEPCLGLLHTFEGRNGTFEAVRTQDPAGNWEIGWSHKLSGMFDPLWDVTIDKAKADELAARDLEMAAVNVSSALGDKVVASLTEGQYAALIDFTYNVGYGAFMGSTLCHLVKAGSMHLVPAEFMKWVYARVNGKETVLNGLINRRKAEVSVWLA